MILPGDFRAKHRKEIKDELDNKKKHNKRDSHGNAKG
jgi:hypothetical protein